MSAPGQVLVFQAGMPTIVDPLTLSTSVPPGMASLAASLAAATASIVTLTQRVAVLEGKPDPCFALSGTLPLATLQIGVVDVQVAVPGLLSTDRVAVEVLADIPVGLTIGAIRPSPISNGILLVQTSATAALTNRAALPLAVTALR